MKSISVHDIKRVEELQYLGIYISSTQYDVSVKVWSA